MKVPCHYCQRPCRLIRPAGRQTDYTPYWQCDYHGAVRIRHFLTHDQKIRQIALVCFYKEVQYQAVFMMMDPQFKFRIDRIHAYPKTSETVMTLDQYPDLTPDNVQSKIATYILLS
mgnify:FL=1